MKHRPRIIRLFVMQYSLFLFFIQVNVLFCMKYYFGLMNFFVGVLIMLMFNAILTLFIINV